MALGNASLYKEDERSKLSMVGYVKACSMYGLSGPSYVHIYKESREQFGLPGEPYDWFFDTFKEAVAWAYETIGC